MRWARVPGEHEHAGRAGSAGGLESEHDGARERHAARYDDGDPRVPGRQGEGLEGAVLSRHRRAEVVGEAGRLGERYHEEPRRPGRVGQGHQERLPRHHERERAALGGR